MGQNKTKYITILFLFAFTIFLNFLELGSLGIFNQLTNSMYDIYKNTYKSAYNVQGKLPKLKNDANGKLAIDSLPKSNINFYNYNSNENLANYIREIDKNGEIKTKELNYINNLISSDLIINPADSYISGDLNSLSKKTIEDYKPIIIPLLFFQLDDNKENVSNLDYKTLYNKSLEYFNKSYADFINNNIKINVNNTLIGNLISDKNKSYYRVNDFVELSKILSFQGKIIKDVDDKNINSLEDKIKYINSKYKNSFDKEKNSLVDDFSSYINSQLSKILQMSSIYNLKNNPLITFNQMFYDKNYDTLGYEYQASSEELPSNTSLSAYDFSSYYSNSKGFDLGNPNNVFDFKNTSSEEFKSLTQINKDGSINCLLTKIIAKYANFKVGDSFIVEDFYGSKHKLKISGIIKNTNYSRMIFVDYKTLFYNQADGILTYSNNRYYPKNINTFNASEDLFTNIPINVMRSKKSIFKGKINPNKLENSINNLKINLEQIPISVENNTSFIGTIFFDYFNYLKIGNSLQSLTNLNIDSRPEVILNTNILKSSNSNTSVTNNDSEIQTQDINLSKSLIYTYAKKTKNITYIFIFLSNIVVLLILVIVINTIIEESESIILTFKAMGYNNKEINKIVFGIYFIFIVLIFVFVTFCNLLFWKLISLYIWKTTTMILEYQNWITNTAIVAFIYGVILTLGFAMLVRKTRNYIPQNIS